MPTCFKLDDNSETSLWRIAQPGRQCCQRCSSRWDGIIATAVNKGKEALTSILEGATSVVINVMLEQTNGIAKRVRVQTHGTDRPFL